jgi:hypothetical protein
MGARIGGSMLLKLKNWNPIGEGEFTASTTFMVSDKTTYEFTKDILQLEITNEQHLNELLPLGVFETI